MTGLFSRYAPLQGKAWLRDIPPEDRKVFAEIGLSHNRALWSIGGKARASTARRDSRGRFMGKDK